jgi:hypothetical protein
MNRMMPSYMPMQDLTRQQDVSGVQPIFQNIGAQQAMQNAAMQQGMGLTNQAGMTVDGKQAGAGMNPMAMAMMLRKGGSNPYMNAQRAMQQYGAGNVYGYGGMGQVPTTTTGMD